MQCGEGLTWIQRQTISQKEYQCNANCRGFHSKAAKSTQNPFLNLGFNHSETERLWKTLSPAQFSLLKKSFKEALAPKLSLIVIFSFLGYVVILVGDKKIKRSLVAQFWRTWKSVKLDCVSYLPSTLLYWKFFDQRSQARQVFFTSSSDILGCLYIHIGIQCKVTIFCSP